ncbi:MAG TPA: sugar ABC transporter substrate-binding protein [Acetobacteraceae bacterium]|nr:sugar ABC transporter substrate-binding protein [Acetobacteraceae bacterium]
MKKLILAAAFAGLLPASQAMAATTIRMVEVITSPPRTVLLKSQIAAFEKANPGIHVKLTSLAWGTAFQKLLSMVQAGDTPDVVEMPDRWLGLYGGNGKLFDMQADFNAWPDHAKIGPLAEKVGTSVGGKLYQIPYGYYVHGLLWNTKLFKQAGLSGPPATMQQFYDDAAKLSKLPGKYGYCLRGGAGGFAPVQMFMDTMDGKPGYFNPNGTSIFSEPGAIKGLQMLMDIYRHGYAPKDSVSWAFNEVVSGFYTGTCAMLDQDPDSLIGIVGKMNPKDFAVAPMPVGPSGKAYPTLGYGGWAIFAHSKHKGADWKLISTLLSPQDNLAWSKLVGTLPIYDSARKDPHFATANYKGFFDELKNPQKYVFVEYPTYLPDFAYFFDDLSLKSYQQALLGQKSAKQVADRWAAYLTKRQLAYMAKHPAH